MSGWYLINKKIKKLHLTHTLSLKYTWHKIIKNLRELRSRDDLYPYVNWSQVPITVKIIVTFGTHDWI